MTDFWLGAFIALAVWGMVSSILSGICATLSVTHESTIGDVLFNLIATVLFLLLTVLVYTDVIL